VCACAYACVCVNEWVSASVCMNVFMVSCVRVRSRVRECVTIKVSKTSENVYCLSPRLYCSSGTYLSLW